MAKKKKVTKKKKAKQDAYVHAIVIIIFSLLLVALIYIKSGYIGEHLSPMLGGIMGWIKYFLPIGTFAIGITLIKEDKEFVMPKITQYVVIILCICAFMTSMQLSGENKKLNINDDFSEIVSDGYDLGTQNKGGGVIRRTCCCTNDKTTWNSRNKCGFNRNSNTSYNIYFWNKTSRNC